MKHYFLLIATFCFGLHAFAQSDYSKSLTEYQRNYKKDLSSIIKEDTAFVEFFPIDPGYRVLAKLTMMVNEPVFKMATSSGITKEAQKIASVQFSLNGKEYTLYAYQLLALRASSQYKDNFFIPFFDASSGDESYGGGRYLDFVLADIVNNQLIVDFNKAYNPYCAFRSGYNCPIPPRENGLKVAIRAGEKNFGKSNH